LFNASLAQCPSKSLLAKEVKTLGVTLARFIWAGTDCRPPYICGYYMRIEPLKIPTFTARY